MVFPGQHVGRHVDHVPELLLGLAAGEAADGEAGHLPLHEPPGAVPPLLRVQPALGDDSIMGSTTRD